MELPPLSMSARRLLDELTRDVGIDPGIGEWMAALSRRAREDVAAILSGGDDGVPSREDEKRSRDDGVVNAAGVELRAVLTVATQGRTVVGRSDIVAAVLELARGVPISGSAPDADTVTPPSSVVWASGDDPSIEEVAKGGATSGSNGDGRWPAEADGSGSPVSRAGGDGPRSRVFRVFVSSTFRDLGVERDLLVKRVFPRLRVLCESRGVVFGEVDLRWGVLDEVNRSGFIGDCLA